MHNGGFVAITDGDVDESAKFFGGFGFVDLPDFGEFGVANGGEDNLIALCEFEVIVLDLNAFGVGLEHFREWDVDVEWSGFLLAEMPSVGCSDAKDEAEDEGEYGKFLVHN